MQLASMSRTNCVYLVESVHPKWQTLFPHFTNECMLGTGKSWAAVFHPWTAIRESIMVLCVTELRKRSGWRVWAWRVCRWCSSAMSDRSNADWFNLSIEKDYSFLKAFTCAGTVSPGWEWHGDTFHFYYNCISCFSCIAAETFLDSGLGN